jgi:hypothetical protein
MNTYEIFTFIQSKDGVTATDVSKRFDISIDQARSWLSKQKRRGFIWAKKGNRNDFPHKDITESRYFYGVKPPDESEYLDERDKTPWWEHDQYIKKKAKDNRERGHTTNVMYMQYVNAMGSVTPSLLSHKFDVNIQTARVWLSNNAKTGRLGVIKGDKTIRPGHIPEENRYYINNVERIEYAFD